MNNKKLLALFGLKWNPFLSDVPTEALYLRSELGPFIWRVENLVLDGGIAAITGEPGYGKSVALRLIDEKLRNLRDVVVAKIDRPQSGLSDFYRELGAHFNIELRMSNRFGGFQALRKKWRQHIDATLFRPILLIDEAQEMQTTVLSELRLLLSEDFDTRRILTVILAGDGRLFDRLRDQDLLPLSRRIRSQLNFGPLSDDEMKKMLEHVLAAAGNKQLMTKDVLEAVVAHSMGNPSTMMTTGDELLSRAMAQEKAQIDEKLFFELYEVQKNRPGKGLPLRRPLK